MLAPDGAGVNAVPGANLSNRNLTMAYLIGANLSTDLVYDAVRLCRFLRMRLISRARISARPISRMPLWRRIRSTERESQPGQPHQCELLATPTLTGANLDRGRSARGELRGRVRGDLGITAAQLYSTASYQAHDLTGIGLGGNNLAGVNLAGQNLTNANFIARR